MAEELGGGASRSTEPATGTSAATDVSLREYLVAHINAAEKRSDLRFEAMKEHVEVAFQSSQRAIDKADIAVEKRFEGVNEFRAALSDQATRFVTIETLSALTDKLQASINRNRDDLADLAKRVDLRQGELEGQRMTKGSIYSLVFALAAGLSIIVILANHFSG